MQRFLFLLTLSEESLAKTFNFAHTLMRKALVSSKSSFYVRTGFNLIETLNPRPVKWVGGFVSALLPAVDAFILLLIGLLKAQAKNCHVAYGSFSVKQRQLQKLTAAIGAALTKNKKHGVPCRAFYRILL